ncbi:MAG: Stk1 family PASTA domain-containing Ser/Thr kinase [Firmicutes bacterium]|nr:Stk1 family PASTA domain-containing Ser/Thr kinase [Bacillota bacterium]
MITRGDKINDRYQIVKTIGEGGMANVYLAVDTILNRNVAVKVLRGDLADDEKFVRRFQREALSASKLSHPNIVEMYDVGEDNGLYYIVMEYIEGKTLKNLIKKRGALTLPEVIDIMIQLTSGLMCAHDSYIIHRDIKPQNVLILEDGRVKITDFGIAMALNSNELTQTNSVMGSVHYLPPEQANGSGSTIKSDIYSLGILMYELITGKLPFKGDNAVEIAIKQMKEPIPSICKDNAEIPQSIENIILKACAKNPKNRYDSAKEMHDDIKNALTEEGLKQQKNVYLYSENDLDETKIMPVLTEKTIKEEAKEIKKKKSAKDKTLIVMFSICAILVAAICSFIIFYPKFVEVKETTVPDVRGLTVVEAETILKEHKLSVAGQVIEKESEDIEPGKVIGTDYHVGRTVKEGTLVSIIIAKESGKITVQNYTGQDYRNVQVNLNNAGLNVLLEQKKIEKKEQDKYKENAVVSQSAEAGTKLEEGDTIILYYAVFTVEYPDFVNESYNIGSIEAFCEQYNVKVNIEYKETTLYDEGTILAQSRSGEVVEGTSITITVAKKPIVVEPEVPEEPEINEDVSGE